MKRILIVLAGMSLAAAAAAAAGSWTYQETTDKMTSKATKTAGLTSANSLHLGFPYQGENTGMLVVRQSPRHGLNVLVSIQKGQIICRTYDGCSVKVRFDDAPPVTFRGANAQDHSSTVVFLEPERRFVDAARKARRILVELTIYQAGTQVLEFGADRPLEWVK